MREILKRLRKDERGLTLVELLAVVVILGIVGGIAFVSIGNVIDNTKIDAHIANAQQLVSAAKVEEASSGWPGDAGFTTSDGSAIPGTKLETIDGFVNPWGDEEVEYYGIVKKVNDEYIVTISGDGGKCEITDVPESELSKGRKHVCGYGITTPPSEGQ